LVVGRIHCAQDEILLSLEALMANEEHVALLRRGAGDWNT
jgi:hypothetical protein